MVSLAQHLNRPGSGAVFFDGSLNMDDEEHLQPVLVSQEHEDFKKLDTIPIAVIPLVTGIGLEIAGIILVVAWPEENKCDPYFIYLYLHCIYWLIVLISDCILKSKHRNLRMLGYLNFYQTTYRQIRIPFFIVSLWNTAYLLITVVFQHTHKMNYEANCPASDWYTPVNYINILSTIEIVIIVKVYISYIKQIREFNLLKPQPDVMSEEWLSSFTQDSYAAGGEVGYHQRGSNLTELLEKQADLIRYLRDQNDKLNTHIMLLSWDNYTTAS